MLRLHRPTAVLALALAGSLTACSSGADPQDAKVKKSSSSVSVSTGAPTTEMPNPSAVTSPAPNSVTSSSRLFNFVIPNGWNLTANPKTEAYLSSTVEAHQVAPTIVVTLSGVKPAPVLDEVLNMTTLQARQDGSSVSSLPQRQIGGERALGFKAAKKDHNVDVTRTYYVVAHEKQLFTVVLTSATADQTASENTLNSLLASWSWTKAGDGNSTANGTTPAASPTSTSTPASPSPSASASASPSASPSSAASASAKPSPSASKK